MPQSFTIVVTDSGLGGLATTAELVRRMRNLGPAPAIEIVFFNALADYALGYNAMATTAQKVAVFHNALESMAARYRPDRILIACNTLSVIHEQTPFSQRRTVPVVGIVDTGVGLMLEFLRAHPVDPVVICGTQTTIDSGLYPRLLVERGIARDRIVSQAYSTVMMEIEKDPDGPTTTTLCRPRTRPSPRGRRAPGHGRP